MSKNKQTGMPMQARKAQMKKKADAFSELQELLGSIGFRTVLYRDVMEESRNQLKKAGRLQQKESYVLDLQIKTVDAILSTCMGVPEIMKKEYRAMRKKEDFDKEVKSMMDVIAPIIIHGLTRKPGVFILPVRGKGKDN